METKSWKEIKDEVYGIKGTERRDGLERDIEGFKIRLLLRKAREDKNLTQLQLADLKVFEHTQVKKQIFFNVVKISKVLVNLDYK